MVGRCGGPVAAAKEVAGTSGVPTLRYSSIPCAIRKVLHASMLPLVEHFERGARSQGLYRHVVSLVANEIAIESPEAVGRDIFLFYTQVYSAVDRYVRHAIADRATAPPSKAGAVEHFDVEVQRFFTRHPVGDGALELLRHQSPVLVRQQECRALATAAHELIEMFPQRLRRFVHAKVVQLAIESDIPVPTATEMKKIVTCIVDTISLPKSKELLELKDDAVPASMRASLGRFIVAEREALGDPADVAKALGNKQRHFELLPHLRRISDASLSMLKDLQLLPQREHVMVDSELQDVGECLPCDEEEESDNEEEDEHREDASRVWTRKRRPKSFALLPVAKLQRSMAFYGWTELTNLFRALRTEDKKRRKQVEQRKRKRGEDIPDEAPGASDALEAPAAEFPDPHLITFGRQLFNFCKLKGKSAIILRKNPKSWELANFRTDGIRAVLTFVSGSAEARCAPHVDMLLKPGYRIPQPSEPVSPATKRGLFRITQTRNDAALSDAWANVGFLPSCTVCHVPRHDAAHC
jgi:hypothetical protein